MTIGLEITRLFRRISQRLGRALNAAMVLATVAAAAGDMQLYESPNLQGDSLSAECNPGGATDFPCNAGDVAFRSYPDHAEVTSNPLVRHTYVNAIGFRPFYETFTNGYPIGLFSYTYTAQVRLPVLPAPDVRQTNNPQAVHVMIQLWDGRNGLWPAAKHTLEATIYWDLNPWTPDYGKIKIYSGSSLTPTNSGLTLKPDTAWHTLRVTADFQRQEYLGIEVDALKVDLPGTALAQRDHSLDTGWATDNSVKLSLTTESLAAFPANPGNRFTWTTQFRNVVLSAPNPQLGWRETGKQLILSWPASTGHFFIETTDSLAPPVSWRQLNTPPVQTAGVVTVTAATGVNGSQFYRLTGP